MTTSVLTLAQELDAQFRSQCSRLDLDEPWFGRIELASESGAAKPYLIGHGNMPAERIIDWRHPLARAYYEAKPGETFELDVRGMAQVSGRIASRCQITPRARTIKKLQLRTATESAILVAGENGFVDPAAAPRAHDPQVGLGDIRALLTPEQYRLITTARENAVILQGRAGSGKTSVAMHRVAWLTHAEEQSTEPPVDPAKVLIVMFNRALSSFVRTTLAPLGIEGARLNTFHGWALEEIRRGYRGEIETDTAERAGRATAGRLKKQVGILRAIDAFVERQVKTFEAWLKEKLLPYDKSGEWLARFQDISAPVVRRAIRLRSLALSARDAAKTPREQRRLAQIHTIFVQALQRLTQYKEELLNLLTDRSLLRAHLSATDAEVDELVAFQKAMQADGGTERRPGPKVSFEDFALLLCLMQKKNGGFPDKDRDDEVHVYDHLVVDEAQDFGAVELAVLFSAVRTRTGVTIVGDLNQKILPDVEFIGWDKVAEELGLTGAVVARLEVAHRATAPIMKVADTVIGDTTPLGRPGATPTLTLDDGPSGMFDAVAERARAAIAQDPNAHVCIVCRHRRDLDAAYEAVRSRLAGLPVRRAHHSSFEFAAGVSVTNMAQVKGLEFDAVFVLDPTDANYPATTEGRRHLYTVVTRAKDSLAFFGTEEPGVLLCAAVAAGLVEREERTEVQEVVFGEADQGPF